jgi:hypothetical protein
MKAGQLLKGKNGVHGIPFIILEVIEVRMVKPRGKVTYKTGYKVSRTDDMTLYFIVDEDELASRFEVYP